MSRVIYILLTLGIVSLSVAEPPSTVVTSVSAPMSEPPSTVVTSVPTPAPTLNSTEEITVLKAQLAASEKYNERVLETSYWSIGITTGVFALLLGAQWLSNYRVHKREFEELRATVTSLAKEHRENSEQLIAVKMAEIDKQLNGKVDAQIENLLDRLRSETNALQGKLREFEYNFLELDAMDWISKGVLGNTLSAYVGMLNLAVIDGDDRRIMKLLGDLKSLLKTPEQVILTAFTIGRVLEILEKLDKKYEVLRDDILHLIKEVKRVEDLK